MCTCPALRPRWSLGAHDRRALRCCLPLCERRRPPRLLTFGAPPRGPRTRCLRFAAALADGARARLASGCDQLCQAARPFRERGPPDASGGFRDDHPLIASSSSRLSWRTHPLSPRGRYAAPSLGSESRWSLPLVSLRERGRQVSRHPLTRPNRGRPPGCRPRAALPPWRGHWPSAPSGRSSARGRWCR